MSKALTNREMTKMARELERAVSTSRRKLLEFEVMMSQAELQAGKADRFGSAADLLKKVS